MADSTAQFQEVLALTVDLDLFKQEMSKVADIYKSSLTGISTQSIGTGEVVQGIRDLQATIERLGSAGSKVLNNLTQAMVDTAGSVEKGVSGINAGLDTLAKNQAAKTLSDNIANSKTSFDKFVESLSNIPNMIGNVLAFSLAWKVAGEAISLVGEAIAAPFKAIQEGVQYARQLEQTTADLQGVLAANITLSKDYPTNFKLAGDAAEIVRKKLQDIALATGLTTQGLQSAFKQLAEAGGGAFVTDINQLVQLTELFGLSMKAAGKDVNATRTLLSELPALLSGTQVPTSKLLEVLHLTKTEWEAIRVSALAHHDLLAQLAPILQPYTDVVANAGTRQQVLLDQLDLMKQRIEASFSAEVFAGFTAALITAKDLLTRNEGEITAIGRAFADMVVTVGQLGIALARTFGGDLLKIVGYVATELSFLFNALSTVITVVSGISKALNTYQGSGPLDQIRNQAELIKQALSQGGQKFADDLERAAANAADIDQNTTKFRAAFDAKIAARKNVPAEAQGDVAQTPFGTFVGAASAPRTPLIDNTQLLKALSTQLPILSSSQPRVPPQKSEALQLLKEELTARIDAVKEEGQTELDYINRLEHLKDISSEQAAEFRVARFKQTFTEISHAADDVLSKAQTAGLSKPQVDSLTSLVGRIKSVASRTEGKDVTAVLDEQNTKQFKQTDDALSREKAAYDDHQRSLLALDQELLKEKILSNAQVAQNAIETQDRIYQNDRDVLEKKFINAQEDADLQTKLSQEMDNLDKAHTDRLITDSEKLKAARLKDRQEEFAVENQARQVNISSLEQRFAAGQIAGGPSKASQAALSVDIGQLKLDDANAKAAQATFDYVQTVVAANAAGQTNTLSVQQAKVTMDALKVAAAAAAVSLQQIKDKASPQSGLFGALFGNGPDGSPKDTLEKAFGGDDLSSKLENTGASVNSLTNNVVGAIGQIQQGLKQGGVLGGIGAALQNPLVGAIPIAGPFLPTGCGACTGIRRCQHAADQHLRERSH